MPLDLRHDLLFAILSLQSGRLDAERLAEAWGTWRGGTGTTFETWVVRHGGLSPEEGSEVRRLVEDKLREHDGDAGAALTELLAGRAPAAPAGQAAHRTMTELTPSPPGHVLLHTLDHVPTSHERYTLSSLHAQGGLGQVWLARDVHLGRDVAFKELRPEVAANASLWARFLKEARVTGQLEHPGIVPVYELARRPGSGAPFYTMRFVRGRTLTEAGRAFHDKRAQGRAGPLDMQALLTSFVGVANAVAYAHSRGVIHRDLKGDNVVLGDYGEVIVLDWGLAKVLDRDDGGAAGEVSSPVPETGEGARSTSDGGSQPPLSVDDHGSSQATVHGQVLGTPAYMPPEQAEGRLDRVDRLSDVYGLGAILYEILTGQPPFRGSDTQEILRRVRRDPPVRPRTLVPEVPAALEAVCLKALAKEPAARYASAAEVAAEVQRFLADEPVAAYREPLARRAGRWARRHRTTVAAAAVLLVTAVVALSVGTVLLRQKQLEVATERSRAEENFSLARDAVDRYLTRVSDSPELKAQGLEPLRRKLLDTAKEFYQEFVKRGGDDPGLRDDLGAASLRLGNIDLEIGDNDQAEAAFHAAIDIFEDLSEREPGNTYYRAQTAALHGNLGWVYAGTGRTDEAEAEYRRALEIESAFPAEVQAQPQRQSHVANLYDRLGILYSGHDRAAESEEAYRHALSVRERLVESQPDSESARNELIQSYNNLANLFATTGRAAEAVPYLEKAVVQSEDLVRDHPGVPDYLNALGASHDNLAGAYVLTGDLERARSSYRRSLSIREDLVRTHPVVLEYRLFLGSTYCNLGELNVRAGKPESSLPWFAQAIDTLRAVLAKEPRHATGRYYLSYTYSWRARALEKLDRYREAVHDWDEAIALDDRNDPSLRKARDAARARS